MLPPRTPFKTRGDFEAVAAKLWNCLSLSLHCTDSTDTFKMQLNTMLHRKSLIFLFYVFIVLYLIVLYCYHMLYFWFCCEALCDFFSVKSAK